MTTRELAVLLPPPSSCSLSSFVYALWFGLILSLGFVFCSRCSFHRSSIRWRLLCVCVCVFCHDCHFLYRTNNSTHSSHCARAHPVSTLSTRTLIFLSTQLPLPHSGWCSIAAIFISKGNIFLCRYFLILVDVVFASFFSSTLFSPFRQLQFFMMFLYNFLLAGCILFLLLHRRCHVVFYVHSYIVFCELLSRRRCHNPHT